MKHGYARECIPALLTDSGFDARAHALVHAALIRSDSIFTAELGDLLHQAAYDLDADHGNIAGAPSLTTAVPDDVAALCNQLAPLIIDHPQNIPHQISSLQHLATLWPHANRDERTRLRLNWLGSLCSRSAPADSYVLRTTLREWQRDLPTIGDEKGACAAVLCDMLQSPTAKHAYSCLSLYLGAQADLPTLSWTLGVLSEQILLHHFDPRGHSVHALLGTIACEQLVTTTRPETLVTLVSQLAHYIWWCARNNRRRELQPSQKLPDTPLIEAVREGDIYAAQRAARLALADRSRFWSEVSDSLALVVNQGHSAWTIALAAIVAVRYRGGERAVLSPDDAATVGAALASAKYRADHSSARLVSTP